VINKPAAVFALIPTKKSKNFTLVQLNLKSAEAGAELLKSVKYDKNVTCSRLATGSFSELIKVNEELLDASAVFYDRSLDSFYNVVFKKERLGDTTLVGTGVAVGTRAHMLNWIAQIAVQLTLLGFISLV